MVLTMIDPVRARSNESGEVGEYSIVRRELESVPVEPGLFADCPRNEEVPADIITVWDDVVRVFDVLLFGDTKNPLLVILI